MILNNVIGFDVKAWDPVVVVQETNTTTGVISYVFPADPAYAAAYANVGSKVGNIVYALAPQYRDLGFANAAYAPANSSSFGHTGRPVGYVLDTATNTYIQKNLPSFTTRGPHITRPPERVQMTQGPVGRSTARTIRS